jgi:hypothetical protein
MRHELGHGLGIITYRDKTTGALPSGHEMTWDKFVQIHSDGSAWFTGPNAEAVYGGPVQVTTLQNGEQYAHLGNSLGDADGQDLMNGVQGTRGKSYPISALDLAILKDWEPRSMALRRPASPALRLRSQRLKAPTLRCLRATWPRRSRPSVLAQAVPHSSICWQISQPKPRS